MKHGIAVLVFAGIAAAACVDSEQMTSAQKDLRQTDVQVPSGLRTINIGGDELTFWPFISPDLGTTTNELDPVNLIFRGNADPRLLRAALLSLDGDRSAFGIPNVFPFNCTWSDANGIMQAAYADNVGWTGSVVQLQCGTFTPLRFHLRLFPAGDWTLANAHFDMHIPNTADHQVISWEIPEQIVLVDFVRSGLLGAAPDVVTALNPAPYRTIDPMIYNGMPADLRALIGGPAVPVSSPVPITTDGNATLLKLAGSVTPTVETRTETLNLTYDTPMPRPFCNTGPLDWVYATGPITLVTTVTQSEDGTLTQQMRAHGRLTVTALNPVTGEMGASTEAEINENHEALYTGAVMHVNSIMLKKQLQAGGFGASQQIRLQLGGTTNYSKVEKCN